MQKILLTTLFVLMLSNFAFSQNKLSELEKLKKIKIFKSTQKDVQKLLPKYIDEDSSREVYPYIIRAEIGYINIVFSKGDCGEDEYWNVAKGLVTGVSVSNIGEIKLKDLGFNLKTFKKEIEDKDFPEEIEYHDEKKGILIRANDGEVKTVVFYPPKSKKGLLCTNENTAEIISGEQRLFDTVSVIACMLLNMPPVLNQIVLSETEVFASNKNESIGITVRADATDPEGDVLTYNYKVSGGRIIGQGSNVTWDLTDVKPGTYNIMTGVDDGSGVTNKMTKTIVVK